MDGKEEEEVEDVVERKVFDACPAGRRFRLLKSGGGIPPTTLSRCSMAIKISVRYETS